MDRKKKIIELLICMVIFIAAVGYCIYISVSTPKEGDASNIAVPTETPTETNYEINIYQPTETDGVTWDVQED